MSLSITKIVRADPPQVRNANFRARLVIRPEENATTSPFLALIEDWFSPPAGFPMHPHRGIETVSFILEGQMLHEDHTGASGKLNAGSAAFMTAGGGVMHSEMPGPQGVHSLQLWLNLPANQKRVKARYTDLSIDQAPVHLEDGVEAHVYAGKVGQAAIAHGSTWPLTLIDLKLAAGRSFDIPVPANERVFAYMLDGDALIGAQSTSVTNGDVAWAELSTTDTNPVLTVKAQTAVRLLLYASPPIDEPIVMGGPFVMNTEEEIAEAFADLQAGRLTQ